MAKNLNEAISNYRTQMKESLGGFLEEAAKMETRLEILKPTMDVNKKK